MTATEINDLTDLEFDIWADLCREGHNRAGLLEGLVGLEYDVREAQDAGLTWQQFRDDLPVGPVTFAARTLWDSLQGRHSRAKRTTDLEAKVRDLQAQGLSWSQAKNSWNSKNRHLAREVWLSVQGEAR